MIYTFLFLLLSRLFHVYCENNITTIATDKWNENDHPFTYPPPAITGGESTTLGEFPFMAALGWKNSAGELHFHGGGMVISPTTVLTAAHCVFKDEKIPDVVFLGGKYLSEIQSIESFFATYSVVNVTIFPEYSPTQAYHDIAILELNQPTWFPPVCVWNCGDIQNLTATAIGYGLTEFAGLGSQQLLKVNLTIFPTEYCAPFFKRQRKFKNGLSESHICAGDKDGVKDTCQGDSGGPLLVHYNNKLFAAGVTSSGQACSGFPPAIYTKIETYIEWIAKVLEEKGQSLKKCECS